ncbi:MAG: 50S ribosomal protein L29 [Candidatus Aenigmarchaeota archaeon]|nr:50S ribosomal protein L29 [Candidatus Aenigmarchaeota archaeon]
MAMLRTKQAREMSDKDRNSRLSEMRLDLMKETGGIRMGKPLKNTGRIGELKRSIARILTIKNEIRRQNGAKKK